MVVGVEAIGEASVAHLLQGDAVGLGGWMQPP